ncbi:MAG TPA: MFS transporter [Candidatus Eisenbergiella merdavium]|uniref:MFS transporter n=1 Tax=Candidatus Eisenbergiella merdavium TaxID=2838551 RepID=A0A9D2NID0_9FIRM|nr:MFS transporter [Candidatus Eisenbergiella merdavium]
MEKRGRLVFTIYVYVFMMGFAVAGTMFSTVLPRIIEDYGLSLDQAGLFAVFTNAGNMSAMLVTGFLGDRYRKSVLIGLTFMGLSVGLALIGLTPPFFLLLCFEAFVGICSSMLNLLITAFVSDMYGEEREKYINLVHMFYGLGSLLGSIYPMMLSGQGLAWRYSYLFLAAVIALTGISFFIAAAKVKEPKCLKGTPGEMPEVSDQGVVYANASGLSSGELLFDKRMLVLGFMGFLYMGGHQNTFSTWFQTYLQSTGPQIYSEEYTSVCMTTYWIGMVASRMIGALLADRVSPRFLIRGGCLGGAAMLGLGMIADTPYIWIVAAACLGICTGVIYPLIFSFSCGWFPDDSAKASSIVGIFTSVGSMLCGWLVGKIAGSISFSLAMLIPWITLPVVFLLAGVCLPGERKQGGRGKL